MQAAGGGCGLPSGLARSPRAGSGSTLSMSLTVNRTLSRPRRRRRGRCAAAHQAMRPCGGHPGRPSTPGRARGHTDQAGSAARAYVRRPARGPASARTGRRRPHPARPGRVRTRRDAAAGSVSSYGGLAAGGEFRREGRRPGWCPRSDGAPGMRTGRDRVRGRVRGREGHHPIAFADRGGPGRRFSGYAVT